MKTSSKILFLLATLLIAVSANAQRLNVSYTFSTDIDSTKWIPLDSTAQSLMAINAIRTQQAKDIGFDFYYAGTSQTKFSVNKYGYLHFGTSLASISPQLYPLGSNSGSCAPGVVALPRYSNTMIDSASHALYQVVGDTGDRVLVVEMRVKVINASALDTGYALFQIQLHEATKAIRIIFGDSLSTRIPYNYQMGFAASTNDVAFIDVDSNQLLFANTTNQLNDTSSRPEQWRWYQIEYDSNYCYHYTTPWGEDFNTDHYLSCWTVLDYDANAGAYWHRVGNTMRVNRTTCASNDWLVSPPIQLPASNDGLRLMYDYKATTNNAGASGKMEVRIATYYYSGSETIVDTTNFITILRTEREGCAQFTPRGLSLAAYAGMQIRIAFVSVGLGPNSQYIQVDNVRVEQTTTPSIILDAPTRSFAYDTTHIEAILIEGSPQSLSYSWHSTMATDSMATLIPTGPHLSIVYTHYGTDTITCIATNIYGCDTSVVIVDVRDCTTVTEYPWWEDFEHDLDCWHQLGGWSATNSHGRYEGAKALRSNSSQSYNETSSSSFWIMSQPFALPDTSILPLPELLWWMRTPSQDQYSNNEFSVRIAVVDSTEIPAVTDFTTIYSRTMYYGGWEHYRLSLEAYAGQTVRIMFHNVPSHSGTGTYDCVLIDQVEVRSTAIPVVELPAPLRVEQLDSNLFTAHLEEGDTAGLTVTWHSAMAADSLAIFTYNDTLLNITYFTEGIDTLTVIATNRHGSDTATAIVSVNNCPALGIPFHIYFEDSTDLNCWSGFTANPSNTFRVSYNTPWYCAGDSTNHYMTSNVQCGWLVTPAIDLPTDTTDLTLHWYQNGSSNRLGIFISTDSNRYFEPADFNYTVQAFSDDPSHTNGHHSYSLAAFAGRRIHIGFVNGYTTALQLDNIYIAPNLVPPSATLSAPTTAHAGNRITVTAAVEASPRGLTHSWHSTMASAGLARITPADTLLSVYYLDGGMDTITYIANNFYGTDTQQVVVSVDACNTYAVPYTQDFDSTTGEAMWAVGSLPECWIHQWNGDDQYAPHVLTTASGQQYISHDSQVLLMMAGTQSGFDTVAYVTLPRFAVGLRHLSIALTHVHEQMNIGTLTVGYMTDTTFVPITDLPAVMGSGRRDTVSFYSVSGSATHIALRWKHCLGLWYSVAVDDIEVFIPSPETYSVTALTGDTLMGFVTGSGTYLEGDIATLTAVANEGYHFTHWNDGDTAALRQITVLSDTLFTAYFEADPVFYTVSALSADSTMGSVTGSGTYPADETITLTATANQGYLFSHWNDGDTNAMRQIVVISDTTFTAYFEADTTPIGIQHIEPSPSQFSIYPNPATHSIVIDLAPQTPLPAHLTILDMAGRQLVAMKLTKTRTLLNTSYLPASTYFVRISTLEGTRVRKLIIHNP